jgi:uncharacterized cupredoxin-like copper-binding protein
MPHRLLRAAATVALVAALSSCKKEVAPPPAPNIVTITASDFAFAAPDTVPSGWTHIRLVNNGPAIHHVQVVQLKDGRTMDSLMAMFRAPRAPNAPPPPPPSWMHEIGSPNAPAPGDTSDVITNLEPGHYALICFIPDSAGVPHLALGMTRALEVTAASGPTAAEPTADVEIKLSDYTFTESAPLTSGRRIIKVTNDGPQLHEMFVARLDSGVTAQQLVGWIAGGMRGRPPATPMGGTVGIANGEHAYMVADLTPGNYALLCFVPDKNDGKEHIQHGMMKQITVN